MFCLPRLRETATTAMMTMTATATRAMISKTPPGNGIGGAGCTGLPTAMFVPVSAETGIWPQTVVPLTMTAEASVQAVPLQYCIVVLELADE